MKSYWGIVNNVIDKADVLLLLLDARQPYDTINKELIDKVKQGRKPLIYVITKSDLIDHSKLKNSIRLEPVVFVSGRTNLGIETLIQEIFTQAKKVGIQGIVKVGVLGYPNVGKSSLINAMKGKVVARTSGLSGYTKFTQKIRMRSRLLIIDTPGVLPDSKKDFMKSAMIGSLDFTHVKEPEVVVMGLMGKYPGKIEECYGVEQKEDFEETLDDIAVKKGIFRRGKVPDRIRMARLILADWHKGNIKI